MREVEVAIIGAGSAGLYALSQVTKKTKDFIIINGGPYGTTCARVGCMPSKVLIQVAEDFHSRERFEMSGIRGGEGLSVKIPAVLERVRMLRDRFVGGLIASTIEPLGEKKIDGYAKFTGPDTLEVNGETIRAKKIIIATGSTPVMPESWKRFGDRIITTDDLFEQKDLPGRIGVIGLGAIGVEIGQALGRLGIQTHGFDHGKTIGGLSDTEVSQRAVELISRDFTIHQGAMVELEEDGEGIRIKGGDEEVVVDAVIASLGRRPNLAHLNLEAAEVSLYEHGIPEFDNQTMQVGNTSIFIAGDVNAYRPILHEAGDEGRIAGFNAVHSEMTRFQRKTPIGVVFGDPNIASAGERHSDLEKRDDVVVGTFDFSRQGRAIVMGKGAGLLRVYARKSDGKLLGSEMAIPAGEHVAHHLAWAIEQGMSAFDLAKMPFYHPVIEEGLQSALAHLIGQLEHSGQTPVELKTLS